MDLKQASVILLFPAGERQKARIRSLTPAEYEPQGPATFPTAAPTFKSDLPEVASGERLEGTIRDVRRTQEGHGCDGWALLHQSLSGRMKALTTLNGPGLSQGSGRILFFSEHFLKTDTSANKLSYSPGNGTYFNLFWYTYI